MLSCRTSTQQFSQSLWPLLKLTYYTTINTEVSQKVGTNTTIFTKRKSDCAEVDLVSERSFDAGQTLGINARFVHANWRRQPTGGDDFRTTFVNQFTKSVLRNNSHP
ncbi:hypothetical protein POM88_049416 [Heracleum sosnowskyi]|uniref:Uncharacterized protein n=1 Tax=Heracleum sosnowskyi TaxID=360622 RepID=A0AAD8LZH2_9APIA|nr:hypothetical protein POM88_049416 [Heracleum sosnowskyi]